ncbi:MAG TPA: phospholipase D-like domain-containing protein, partial [Opitutus sp.]|nr:phospholipase D-like domain-containing protein [Opitutus sp.]
SKTMSVDDYFVTIGSVNFDNRSFSINDEVALNVLNSDVARDHREMFEADLKNSKPLTHEEFASRPTYIKWADRVCGLVRSQL